MSIFNLVNDWRKLLREQDSETVTSTQDKELSVKKDTPEYDKLVKNAEKEVEKAIEKPKEEVKVSSEPDPTCKPKLRCKCRDSSETSLTVLDIQKILNRYFTSKNQETIEEDGNCNSATRKAIMKFQSDTKIECDACVGDETHDKMRELKLTDIPSKTTTEYGENEKLNTDSSTSGITKFSAAVGSTNGCISIKANNSRPHGYKNQIIAGMVNGVHFPPLLTSPDLVPRTWGHKNMWGNPILLKALMDATAAVTKNFPELSGKGSMQFWSASPKNGGPKLKGKGKYHNSHQTGLDADLTFFTTTSKLTPIATYARSARKKQSSAGKSLHNIPIDKRFDLPRNICFLDHLVRNPAVKQVFLDQPIIGAMIRWIQKNDAAGKYTKLLSELKKGRGGKVFEPGMFGHHNHYHVRCFFPPGSPTMAQWRKMSKSEKDAMIAGAKKDSSAPSTATAGPASINQSTTSAGPGTISAVKKRIQQIKAIPDSKVGLRAKIKRLVAEMKKLSLDDLKSIYGSGFGYALGYVNKSEPSMVYNHNKQFYGASSPKTMAALAQMVKYKGTGKSLNNKELDSLLAYLRGSSGSNKTNRAISMSHFRRYGDKRTKGKYLPYKRSRGPSLGRVDREDIKRVAQVFGITNDRFIWGGANNKQSPRDMFKFFGGLQRMVTGTGTALENEFYKRYKSEVNAVIKAQKKRSHSPNVSFSGIASRGHWGKGGRYGGDVSHSFVIEGKYVLSVYVFLGKKRNVRNDYEEYAVLNTVISKLLEKAR